MNGEKNSVKNLDKSLRQTQVGNVKLVIWAGGFVIQSISAIFKIIVKLGILGEDRIGSLEMALRMKLLMEVAVVVIN